MKDKRYIAVKASEPPREVGIYFVIDENGAKFSDRWCGEYWYSKGIHKLKYWLKEQPTEGVSAELDIQAGLQSRIEGWQQHHRDNGLSWNEISEMCRELFEYGKCSHSNKGQQTDSTVQSLPIDVEGVIKILHKYRYAIDDEGSDFWRGVDLEYAEQILSHFTPVKVEEDYLNLELLDLFNKYKIRKKEAVKYVLTLSQFMKAATELIAHNGNNMG